MASEKHLVLDNDGFFVKEERFRYEDIDATYFIYVQTQKTMNFVASGVDHNVTIRLYLKTRTKPLTINTGPQFLSSHWFSFGKSSTELVIAKFNEISRRTFHQRIEKYMRSMQENGYFIYDGKKFFSNGDIVSDQWKVNLHTDNPWLKCPFLIYYEKKASSFFRSAIQYKIETTMDSDVFFSILEHIYNLRWQ